MQQVFALPLRNLMLMRGTIPPNIQLEDKADLNNGVGPDMMFIDCRMDGSDLCRVCEHRKTRKLLVKTSGALSIEQVGRLLRMPHLNELVLDGNWITEAHFEALSEINRPLSLRLEKTRLSREAKLRLHNLSRQQAQVIITRGGTSVSQTPLRQFER